MDITIVHEINSKDALDSILADYPNVVIDFYATWCGPCKMLAPTLDAIASENTNEDLLFVKIDVDAIERDVSAKYSVRSVPTVLLLKDDTVESVMIGNRTKSEIVAAIEETF